MKTKVSKKIEYMMCYPHFTSKNVHINIKKFLSHQILMGRYECIFLYELIATRER